MLLLNWQFPEFLVNCFLILFRAHFYDCLAWQSDHQSKLPRILFPGLLLSGFNFGRAALHLNDQILGEQEEDGGMFLPDMAPSRAPQPFIPFLAPSPLGPFSTGIIPKLSGLDLRFNHSWSNISSNSYNVAPNFRVMPTQFLPRGGHDQNYGNWLLDVTGTIPG